MTLLSPLAGDGGENLSELTIIQTTDIHCAILPSSESRGWLVLAAAVRERVSAAGGMDKCLLVDCGDTVQGSVEGALSRGMAGVQMMNAFGYDAWIPGNHDTDFGFARFRELARIFRGKTLSLNLIADETLRWTIFRKNGIDVAVLGITYSYSDSKPPLEEILDNAVGEITARRPDLFILAIHNGLSFRKHPNNLDAGAIALKYPQINLLLGGHTHAENPGEKAGSSGWFVQPACRAASFAEIKVLFDRKTRKIEKISSSLVRPGGDVAPDERCSREVAAWIGAAKAYSGRIVAKNDKPIKADPENPESELNLLFCRMMASAVPGCDAVLANAMVPAKGLGETITGQDLFEVAPYDDTICTIRVTGRQLRDILDEQKSHDKKSERLMFRWISDLGAFDGHDSAERPSPSRVIDDKSRYLIALSSYSAAGSGLKFRRLKEIAGSHDSEFKDTGILERDAMRKLLEK